MNNQLQAVIDSNRALQKRARELNIRAGEKLFSVMSQDEWKAWLMEKLSGARRVSEISDFEALRMPELDPEKARQVEVENPDKIEVEFHEFDVKYSVNSWGDTFYAKIEVERESAYTTKLKSLTLPSGRPITLCCGGCSVTTFSELVEKLFASDCREELKIPQEEPWQSKPGYYWSVTEMGQSLKKELDVLVTEHAKNPKADSMFARIEALKNGIRDLRSSLSVDYVNSKKLIDETFYKLSSLIAEVKDEVLQEVWQKQISDGIKKAQEKLAVSEYNAVREICESLAELVIKNIECVQNSFTEFREIWCRRGGSNNGDGWVICPDGTFREHDKIDNPRSRYTSEGHKSWLMVFPEELAVSWKKGSRVSEHEFNIYHFPIDGLTSMQEKTLESLLEGIENEWDGATGLASGSTSPSVGKGWVNQETGKSLTPALFTERQKREVKLREELSTDRKWADEEKVPAFLIEASTQEGSFEKLKKFIANVDHLNPADLDKHICLGCGRDRRFGHFSTISGKDSYEFFQGFDPNDVAEWIWERLNSQPKQFSKKGVSKPISSVGDEKMSNNPFAILAKLKK